MIFLPSWEVGVGKRRVRAVPGKPTYTGWGGLRTLQVHSRCGYTDGGPGSKTNTHSLRGKPYPSRSPLSRTGANAKSSGGRGRKQQTRMIKLLPSIPLKGSSTVVKMIHIQYISSQKTGAGQGRNADYHPRSPHPEMILANIW